MLLSLVGAFSSVELQTGGDLVDSRHAALQSLGIALSPTLGKENLEEILVCHHWGNTLCAKTVSLYGV